MPEIPPRLRPLGGSGDGPGGANDPLLPDELEYASAAIVQEVEMEATVARTLGDAEAGNGTSHPLVEVEYKSSRYNEAALTTLKIVADRYPEQGEIVSVSINDTTIASGYVDVSKPTSDGLVAIDAFDTVRPLKQGSVTADFDQIPLENVVTVVCAFADVEPAAIKLENNPEITATYEGRRIASVLDTLAARVRGVWFTDPSTPTARPVFTDGVSFTPTRHDIEYILEDTDAGLQTAPYDGVRVIGGAKRSNGRTNTLTKNPVTATAGDTGRGARVYRYENGSIMSNKEAKRVAHKHLDSFEMQQGTGEIKLVGNEAIQPFDSVTMPDNLGSAEHLVSEVTHSANVSDGFLTTIKVGGLIEGERGPGAPVAYPSDSPYDSSTNQAPDTPSSF